MYRPLGLTTTGPGAPMRRAFSVTASWEVDTPRVFCGGSIAGVMVADQRSEPSCGSSAARTV